LQEAEDVVASLAIERCRIGAVAQQVEYGAIARLPDQSADRARDTGRSDLLEVNGSQVERVDVQRQAETIGDGLGETTLVAAGRRG